MDPRFMRTALLFGEAALHKLNRSHVVVFGLGAVGSFCLEALARSGVGRFRLVDFDTVKLSNINRQLLALSSTVGRAKADLARERVLDINPGARVDVFKSFAHHDTLDQLLADTPDAIVDAIDAFAPKVELLRQCVSRGLPVFSGMGASARRDPALITAGDISQTVNCPLARRVRRSLRRAGIHRGIRTVFSSEPPEHQTFVAEELAVNDAGEEYRRGRPRRVIPSSIIIPGMTGLRLAFEVIEFLMNTEDSGPSPAIAD